MKEFIDAFKDTSYYKNLFKDNRVIAIYILGSRSVDITDDRSDYDLVVFTDDGTYTDASQFEYLKYKNKKVHWYFNPIQNLFYPMFSNSMRYLCALQLKNINKDVVIYENPEYSKLLQKLHEIKDELSKLAAYSLFNAKKDFIDKILAQNQITESFYSKFIYHLCCASYYLTGEELNKDFLRSIKRIKWLPVCTTYKQLAIQRLEIYKQFIEDNPIDVESSLKMLANYLNI